MLVLSRRTNETIIIGDNEVSITILSVHNNQVKLGIKAPKDVIVHRLEIFNLIQKEKLIKGSEKSNKSSKQ
jgi:carbon storage regulator